MWFPGRLIQAATAFTSGRLHRGMSEKVPVSSSGNSEKEGEEGVQGVVHLCWSFELLFGVSAALVVPAFMSLARGFVLVSNSQADRWKGKLYSANSLILFSQGLNRLGIWRLLCKWAFLVFKHGVLFVLQVGNWFFWKKHRHKAGSLKKREWLWERVA